MDVARRAMSQQKRVSGGLIRPNRSSTHKLFWLSALVCFSLFDRQVGHQLEPRTATQRGYLTADYDLQLWICAHRCIESIEPAEVKPRATKVDALWPCVVPSQDPQVVNQEKVFLARITGSRNR